MVINFRRYQTSAVTRLPPLPDFQLFLVYFHLAQEARTEKIKPQTRTAFSLHGSNGIMLFHKQTPQLEKSPCQDLQTAIVTRKGLRSRTHQIPSIMIPSPTPKPIHTHSMPSRYSNHEWYPISSPPAMQLQSSLAHHPQQPSSSSQHSAGDSH